MRVAVIADIHGNLEAFRKVLEDIESSQVDTVVSLGDNIGYGPEPDAVVAIIRERGFQCVLGNHELAVMGELSLDRFNPLARLSILITMGLISQGTLDYIRGLKTSLVQNEGFFVHGCPPDSTTTYLFDVSRSRVKAILSDIQQKLCFVGHTHLLEIVRYDGREVRRDDLNPGLTALQPGHKYIINAGSVGQPRDGNNKAKYVIWDTAESTIDVRLVPYNIAATAEKIVQLGFPEFYAKRLW